MAETERVRPVRLTLFTLGEANKVADEIRPELEALVQVQRDLERVQSRIDVLELAVAGATGDNPDARELVTLSGRRETLVERIQKGVDTIHKRGCVIKDLGQGLVDFYSLTGDRLIFLCWQLGEPEVSHWHTLDGGFAARRPVPRNKLG